MDVNTFLPQQQIYFQTQETKDVAFRLQALARLRKTIHLWEDRLLAALQADLHKCATEAYMTELGLVLEEIACQTKHLRRWAKPVRKKTSLALMPAKCSTLYEPYGSVLVIAPWNYPLLLSLMPLVGALAAGNCVVLKPSELAPHTAHTLGEMISACFPVNYVAVAQGDKDVCTALLAQPFDFIFYTGGEAVGKIVMQAAAKHLTPVCLELGGKSPCIIDETANLSLAAKRIALGKIINAGQTCVAPDYIFVQQSVKEKFIDQLIAQIEKIIGESCFGDTAYPSIINKRHLIRLQNLLKDERILYGGACENGRLQPTIIEGTSYDTPVMQEEIFGPILPVFSYENLQDVFAFVLARPKPLALYFFSNCKAAQRRVLATLSFGGGCINDTLMHVASSHLGFGGVGASGMGSYHGKNSFLLFSHAKSIVKQSAYLDVPLRYRLYDTRALALLRRLFR